MGSVYATKGVSGGGSVYATRPGTGGSVYANKGGGSSGGSPAPAKAPPAKSGLGGDILHGVAQTGKDLYHMAVDAPAGLWSLLGGYTTAPPPELVAKLPKPKTAGLTPDEIRFLNDQAYVARVNEPDKRSIWRRNVLGYPIIQHKPQAGRYLDALLAAHDLHAAWTNKGPDRAGQALLSLPGQMVHDITHFTDNPGYALADIWGFASLGAGTAARVAGASRALRAGEGLGAVAKAVAKAPEAGTRTIRAGGVEAQVPNSRAALSRFVQTTVNDLRNKYPDSRVLGGLGGSQYTRVGEQLTRQRKVNEKITQHPAALLTIIGKHIKADSPQGVAMRAVLEGTTIDSRIAKHQSDLSALIKEAHATDVRGPIRKQFVRAEGNLRKQIQLAEQARQYVDHTPAGSPRISADHSELAHLTERAAAEANALDQRMAAAGLRDPAALAAAVQKPGRVIVGGAQYDRGVPIPPGVARQRAYVARLESLSARAEARVAKQQFTRAQLTHIGGVAINPDKELNLQGRLDALNTEINKLRKKPLNTPQIKDVRAERLRLKNLEGLRQSVESLGVEYAKGASGVGIDAQLAGIPGAAELAARIDTLTEQLRALGGVAKRPNVPAGLAQEAQSIRNELKRLRANPASVQWGSRIVTPEGRILSPQGSARAGSLKSALSVARTLLDQMERGYATRHGVGVGEIGRTTGLKGAEGFSGGVAHVGYYAKNRKAMGGQFTQTRGAWGIPKTEARFKAFTGKALETGNFRNDVPRIIAENITESERLAAVIRARNFFLNYAHDHPAAINPRYAKAIRTDALGTKTMPEAIRTLVDQFDAGRRLNEHQIAMLARVYEPFRQHIFPEMKPSEFMLDPSKHPDVKWIDQRLLGDLNKRSPLVGFYDYPRLRGALHAADTINNASKAAILYLKPAYAVPNIVGNAFLTVTQQGWAAPANVGRAVRLTHKLPEGDPALMDSYMGEGISGSLHASEGPKIVQKAVSGMANLYGKGVDLPFRRAAFIYEARKILGHRPGKTPWQEIHDLMHNPAKRDMLQQVVERANKALIEYDQMSPVEQNLIRRVLFFYPWLKGSTKYAGYYAVNHPAQTAVMSALGHKGEDYINQQLGPHPSFTDGIFPVGGSQAFPLTSNPASAGILSQPAQLAAVAANFFNPHVPTGYKVASLLTPFLGGASETLAGRDQFGRAIEPNLQSFAKSFVNVPAYTLYQRLTQDQTGRLYPVTHWQALLQYLLGGLAPKKTDKAKLAQLAQKDLKLQR